MKSETIKPNRAPRIFLSYSKHDRERVLGVEALFKLAEAEVFLDFRSIAPGSLWEAELRAALSSCDILCVFWTTNAAKSKWVKREYRTFKRLKPNGKCVPLIADDTPLPPDLSAHQALAGIPALVNSFLAHVARDRSMGFDTRERERRALDFLERRGLSLDRNSSEARKIAALAGAAAFGVTAATSAIPVVQVGASKVIAVVTGLAAIVTASFGLSRCASILDLPASDIAEGAVPSAADVSRLAPLPNAKGNGGKGSRLGEPPTAPAPSSVEPNQDQATTNDAQAETVPTASAPGSKDPRAISSSTYSSTEQTPTGNAKCYDATAAAGPYGYAWRTNRCEGQVQYSNGHDIELLSITYGRVSLEVYFSIAEVATIRWRGAAVPAASVIARDFAGSGYRMSAHVEGQSSYFWPMLGFDFFRIAELAVLVSVGAGESLHYLPAIISGTDDDIVIVFRTSAPLASWSLWAYCDGGRSPARGVPITGLGEELLGATYPSRDLSGACRVVLAGKKQSGAAALTEFKARFER